MLILVALVILVVSIGFKEWKLFLFDPDFARGLGMNSRLMNSLYMGCLF